jgi:type VI secretion system protein ImpJ
VREIAWDYDALKAGKLRLEALSIIFRDGEIVDVARPAPLPPQSTCRASRQRAGSDWHAALPSLAPGGGNATAGEQHTGALQPVQPRGGGPVHASGGH